MTATITIHPAAVSAAVAEILAVLDGEAVAALGNAADRGDGGLHLSPDRPGQIVEDGGYAPLAALQGLVRYRLATPEVRAGLLVGVTLSAAGVAVRRHLMGGR